MTCKVFYVFAGLLSLGMAAESARSNAQTNAPLAANVLTLDTVRDRVLAFNESLQIKMIEAEIARRQYRGEKGIFEPAVVASYERDDSKRKNTQEQQANLLGAQVFDERNNLYNGGLEFLSPIGTRFRLGYNLRELKNNLNKAEGQEYVHTVGITITQPLLKNFGTEATLARIRLAAVSSDLAFQDYRKQLMLVVARAEGAYWDLFLTQEQERISNESRLAAQKLLTDNRARLDVGKSSELEVQQAQAGLSLRLARLSEAHQKFSDANSQLNTLFSGIPSETNLMLRAVEPPLLTPVPFNYYESYQEAFDSNPDYLTKRQQAIGEHIRLLYAKNQRLPQLDLKGSYGFNGLSSNVFTSFDDVSKADFPVWSLGVDLRFPVTGGIKERNDYIAAKLSKQKALIAIKEIEVQIANALQSALIKVRSLGEGVTNYEAVVDFHQRLIETQMARLDVGRIDSKTVLETEEKLFEAKIATAESLVQFQKGRLELELIKGTLLRDRGMELTKKQLIARTHDWLEEHKVRGPLFDRLQYEVTSDYKDSVKHSAQANKDPKEKSSFGSQNDNNDAIERARQVLRNTPTPPQ